MKKFGTAVLALTMILMSLTACGQKEEITEKEEESTDAIIVETASTEALPEETEIYAEAEVRYIDAGLLDLRIEEGRCYSADAGAIYCDCLEVSPDAQDEYSALEAALEADNSQAASNAPTELDSSAEYPIVESNVLVRRADENVLSFMRKDVSDGNTVSRTTRNYNPKTGEEYSLSDVFADVDEAMALLPGGYTDVAQEEMLWTVDNEGVTFYSMDSDGNSMSEFIGFEMYPELFNEGFGLPVGNYASCIQDVGINADIDADGTAEKIVFDSTLNEYGDADGAFTITVDGTAYDFGELYVYEEVPVLIENNDSYYLYVECLTDNDYRYLMVYGISSDGVEFLGEDYDGGFGAIPADGETSDRTDGDWTYTLKGVLTDPENFVLSTRANFFGNHGIARSYSIGEDGMPAVMGDGYYTVVSDCDVTAVMQVLGEELDPETMSPRDDGAVFEGDVLTVIGTDNETFVDVRKPDGSIIRLYVEDETIDGTPVDELFSGIFYAG